MSNKPKYVIADAEHKCCYGWAVCKLRKDGELVPVADFLEKEHAENFLQMLEDEAYGEFLSEIEQEYCQWRDEFDQLSKEYPRFATIVNTLRGSMSRLDIAMAFLKAMAATISTNRKDARRG